MTTNTVCSPTGIVPTRDEQRTIERRARKFWVSIIFGLLGLQVVGGVLSVFLAVGDPSSAIVPNYHKSAINWDTTRRALQLPKQLGWQIKSTVTEYSETVKCRQMRVAITDEAGVGVAGLSVSASIFRHARGQEIHVLRLVEDSPGTYIGQVAISEAGAWQVDLKIEGEHGVAATANELTVM